MLACQRKVGVLVPGSWLKDGSVEPKALRLAASVLVRVPVPEANHMKSPSKLPDVDFCTVPISKVEAVKVGSVAVVVLKLLPFTETPYVLPDHEPMTVTRSPATGAEAPAPAKLVPFTSITHWPLDTL